MKKSILTNIREVSESIRSFLLNPEQMGNENMQNLITPQFLSILRNQNYIQDHPDCSFHLGVYTNSVNNTIELFEKQKFISRLYEKDIHLWNGDPSIEKCLGWIDVAGSMIPRIEEIRRFAEEIRKDGFSDVVLLGMGGSSLCAYVFRQVFETIEDDIELHVLDLTHPDSVLAIENSVEFEDTLFIVASKSGTTAEVNAFFNYFHKRLRDTKRNRSTGKHFIAITDPGTPLADLAKKLKFRKTFLNFPDIGGRYSVLSYFGLVPAAFMKMDLRRLLERAVQMEKSTRESNVSANSAVSLGIALGELARQGRDKLVLLLPPEIDTLGLWIEQLVAESTGKDKLGILPVIGLKISPSRIYGEDRVFVNFTYDGKPSPLDYETLKMLESEGHPVIDIHLKDAYDLGKEFYRWEIATAVAGSVLGVNPFDQPNVQENKTITDNLLKRLSEGQGLETAPSDLTEEGVRFYFPEELKATDSTDIFTKFLAKAHHPGDYVSIQAYLPETAEISHLLKECSSILENWLRIPVTVGYGPRFLHSTGQLHKGGPDNGFFIQITSDFDQDLPVPQANITFGKLIKAQAAGDYEALKSRGKRIIRIHLGEAIGTDLYTVRKKLEKAQTEYFMNLNHTE
jgi:transaldolase / glucose-6-phosphate isomerase